MTRYYKNMYQYGQQYNFFLNDYSREPNSYFWIDCSMYSIQGAWAQLCLKNSSKDSLYFSKAHQRKKWNVCPFTLTMSRVTFKLYDLHKTGSVEPQDLIRIMAQMYSAFYNEDRTEQIKELVDRIFADLDINGTGALVRSFYLYWTWDADWIQINGSQGTTHCGFSISILGRKGRRTHGMKIKGHIAISHFYFTNDILWIHFNNQVNSIHSVKRGESFQAV